MSMFRKPGDETSSSSESSYEYTEEEESSALQQDSVLSRINTLESTASEKVHTHRPSLLELRQNSAQNVRDLMLHSLLEEKTVTEAAAQLGKDRSDPDVQKLANEAYQKIVRQISNNVDDTYGSEEMRTHRAAAQEGISKLTRSNLNRLAVIPEGGSQAITARPSNGFSIELPKQPPSGFDVLSGISAPAELHLRGYPDLQTDRYFREFAELGIVGKGGYGKVYKAKHKLDGSLYAVKRIPISPAKVARIQEHGPQELESMLEEVRSLARFEHNNIVRYHHAWLEFTTRPVEAPVAPKATLLREDRLIEDQAAFPSSSVDSNLQSKLDLLIFDDPLVNTDFSHGTGIVFESSDPGVGAEESKSEADNLSLKEKLRVSKRRTRRGSQASQATIATVSSTRSLMSAVEDVDEDEVEEDIEIIPRSHMPYSQEPASDMSESMLSHSDVPGHLVSTPSTGPILMLNVQMSLCETNLAAFISSERSLTDQPNDQHCFHPCISLELLSNIVSGVEYLHAQGVVHRDLKPANVFLSLSTAQHPPYGSVDRSACKLCPKRNCMHITPRIGDFGLVAALDGTCLSTDSGTKPVGTEFYRPQASRGVSEKLDVFALGVVAFEMLQKFATRMERIAALTNLRRGVFPSNFAQGLGDMGEQVHQLIENMVQSDEQERISCNEVKSELGKLIHILKT